MLDGHNANLAAIVGTRRPGAGVVASAAELKAHESHRSGRPADALQRTCTVTGHDEATMWTLRRNCSMSPRDLGALFVCLGMTTLAVAMVCALGGAWMVLVFALIEILALVAAFVLHARHAGDVERVILSADGLWVDVESDIGGCLTRCELPAAWLHVRLQDRPADRGSNRGRNRARLVELGSHGRTVVVGRFLSPTDRLKLIDELKRELRFER